MKSGYIVLLIGMLVVSYIGYTIYPDIPIIPSINPSGLLHVSGTNIVDNNGYNVILKGTAYDYNAMMGHREMHPTGDWWFGLDDIQDVKAHGGNIIECHNFMWSGFVPQIDIFDQEELTRLDLIMSWFEQEKIYTIFNMANFGSSDWSVPYWLSGGRGCQQTEVDFFKLSDTSQNTNRQNVINIFKILAERYKDNEYVMFGLLNEPFCGSQSYINSYLSVDEKIQLSKDYARWCERAIDAIHSVSNKIVFVDKPYVWFQISESYYEQINRDNIVWEDHLYLGYDIISGVKVGDFDEWAFTGADGSIDRYVNRYVNIFHKPFLMGEFGFIDYSYPNGINHDFPDWREILQRQVNYLKSRTGTNYLWFTYSALDDEWYDWYYYTTQRYDSWTASESSELLDIAFS